MLGRNGFGKDVRNLLFRVDVHEVHRWILEHVVRTGQVDAVSARHMSQLSTALLLDDLDGGFVVLHHLEVDLATEDAAPQLKRWDSLAEEPMREADDLGLGG